MPITYTSDVAAIDFSDLVRALATDSFHNGCTPDELRLCCDRSHSVVFARAEGGAIIGMARLLSDGVCNAYLVDVWTASPYRLRGIASTMVNHLLETVPGQHVGLFTKHAEPFYRTLGFDREDVGMSRVVGSWLRR
jgi:GNAT superfamily N-acetyltransferase